jgi:ribosomal protein S18 acetylase RimI-like enzyme
VNPEAAITFRPATAEDEPFLFELFVGAREASFAALGLPRAQLEGLLRMQHRAQVLGHRAQAPRADEHILYKDGVPAGRLLVDRSGAEWVLVDVCVRDRGQGTGTLGLRALCSEADAAGRAISLQVARDNPAARLYRRAGFSEVGADEVYLEMRRPPGGPTAL